MFSGIGWRSVSTRRLVRSWRVAILAALAAGQLSPVAAGDTLPVKLEIVPSANAVEVGDSVILNVVLRGADNAVAVAPRAFNVRFEMKTPSGTEALPNAVIRAGQSVAQIQLQVTAPGIWAVRASNKELLEGGTVISAKPAGSRS